MDSIIDKLLERLRAYDYETYNHTDDVPGSIDICIDLYPTISLVQSPFDPFPGKVRFCGTALYIYRDRIPIYKTGFRRITFFPEDHRNASSCSYLLQDPKECLGRDLDKILVIGISKIQVLLLPFVTATYDHFYIMLSAVPDDPIGSLIKIVPHFIRTFPGHHIQTSGVFYRMDRVTASC